MLTLQFGQCGNQLGHSLYSLITNDLDLKNAGVSQSINENYKQQSFDRWFSGKTKEGKPIARNILVDTEKKVIHKLSSPKHWFYRPKNMIYQSSGGSANNWAYGYTTKGPQLADNILDVVNRELERIDHLEGLLLLLSSAGGTGSGVGSYMLEQLRDNYPTRDIIASVVLPFSYGEVGTQNYNTVLTLAKLQETVNLGILFENEQIHSICTSVLNNPGAQLPDINDIISKKLCTIFGPVNKSCSINYITRFVGSHPDYKLASIKSMPYVSSSSSAFEGTSKWQIYSRNLKQTLRMPALKSQLPDPETKKCFRGLTNTRSLYNKSAANLIVTRGLSFSADPNTYEEFRDKSLYPSWLGEKDRFCHLHEDRRLFDQDKFVALLTNNSSLHKPLDGIVDRAWNTYVYSAFLHQYQKYGMEKEDFLQAFAMMEKTIKSYKNLNEA